MTWAHLFVAKAQHLLAYHCCSSTPLIPIQESGKPKHSSGILHSNAAFSAMVVLAYDWRSCTTKIWNPVLIKLLGDVWRQL
jgi:hypothetical protein